MAAEPMHKTFQPYRFCCNDPQLSRRRGAFAVSPGLPGIRHLPPRYYPGGPLEWVRNFGVISGSGLAVRARRSLLTGPTPIV